MQYRAEQALLEGIEVVQERVQSERHGLDDMVAVAQLCGGLLVGQLLSEGGDHIHKFPAHLVRLSETHKAFAEIRYRERRAGIELDDVGDGPRLHGGAVDADRTGVGDPRRGPRFLTQIGGIAKREPERRDPLGGAIAVRAAAAVQAPGGFDEGYLAPANEGEHLRRCVAVTAPRLA